MTPVRRVVVYQGGATCAGLFDDGTPGILTADANDGLFGGISISVAYGSTNPRIANSGHGYTAGSILSSLVLLDSAGRSSGLITDCDRGGQAGIAGQSAAGGTIDGWGIGSQLIAASVARHAGVPASLAGFNSDNADSVDLGSPAGDPIAKPTLNLPGTSGRNTVTASEAGKPGATFEIATDSAGAGEVSGTGIGVATGNSPQASVALAAPGSVAAVPMPWTMTSAALVQGKQGTAQGAATLGGSAATEGPDGPPSYATTFPANENPISEGGNWVHTPNSWATIQTVNGHAVSNQGSLWGTNDAYAYLAGTWNNNQSAEATIWETGQNGEAELLLRASDSATQAKAYELNIEMSGGYSQIAVWLGPYNQGAGVSYSVLSEVDSFPAGLMPLVTGDIILGQITGTTIDLYLNKNDGNGYQLINTATDSTLASGSPGMALNRFSDPAQDYGFSSFEAWGGTASPVVTEALANDTGTPSDRITANDALTGTSDANAVVTFTEGSVTLGTFTADATGVWSFDPELSAQGSHTIVASETDPTGNTDTASLSFTYDTIAPAVTAALLSDTGVSATDLLTRIATLSGTGDANAAVTLTEGSSALGTATANAAGAWTFTPKSLSQGGHTIVASETDVAGNTGSASVSFTYDSIAPTVTEALVSDTGAPGDRITANDALTGTSDANAVVTLTEGSATLGTTTADAGGVWNFTSTSLSQGSHTIVARETDPAGNTGSASLSLTYQSIAPGVTEALVSDTGASATDHITAYDSLTGSAAAYAVVTLSEGGRTLGSTTATSSESWSFTPTSFSQGSHTVVATQSDAAGDTGSASLSLVYDTTAPTMLSVAASGNGIVNGTGNLGSGSVVTLTVASSEPALVTGAPTLSLNDGGKASYQSGSGSSALVFLYAVVAGQDTSDLTVTAVNLNSGALRDVAGNSAITSGAVTNPVGILHIDTTRPAVTIGLVADTGKSSTDRITSKNTLSGSGDPSATVTLLENGAAIGTTFASGTGAWTFTPTALSPGRHTITASETDGASNVGTASLTFSYDSATPVVAGPAPVTAGLGALEGFGSSLTARSTIANFTASGGLVGDTYSFILGGAGSGSFALATSGAMATLSTGTRTVTGAAGGRVYALTVTATDATSGVAAASIPVDVVVGSSGADTFNLTSGSGNLGLAAVTPCFIYGQGGNDTLNASGMTGPVVLAGGAGADVMTGGSGTNRYVYGATGESSPASPDLLTNFAVARDLLDFSGLGAAVAAYQGQVALNASVNAHSVAWAVNSATQQTVIYANTANSAGAASMQVGLAGANLGFAAQPGPNSPGIAL